MTFEHEISSLQSSNRCAHLRQSHRTLRDGSFGVTLSQALRARLRSHRPSGTIRNRLWLGGQGSFRAPNDAGKAPRIQACSPDESAVDILLTHQILRVLRLHTSAVLNA